MTELEAMYKYFLPALFYGLGIGFIAGTVLKYVVKLCSKLKKVLNEQ